jgi:hypothetical protein
VLADGALDALDAAGAAAFVTCDTIVHPSNSIPVLDLIGRAIAAPW